MWALKKHRQRTRDNIFPVCLQLQRLHHLRRILRVSPTRIRALQLLVDDEGQSTVLSWHSETFSRQTRFWGGVECTFQYSVKIGQNTTGSLEWRSASEMELDRGKIAVDDLEVTLTPYTWVWKAGVPIAASQQQPRPQLTATTTLRSNNHNNQIKVLCGRTDWKCHYNCFTTQSNNVQRQKPTQQQLQLPLLPQQHQF